MNEIVSPPATTPKIQMSFEVFWLMFTIMFYNFIIAVIYTNLSVWKLPAFVPLVGAGA